MARVIKAGPEGAKAQRRPVPRIGQAGRPVIEREVFRAQQEAAEFAARAEAERERVLAEGRQKASQAREEAQAEGAQEAFAEAAQEALKAFRHRAERYAEAADDIELLALEVVRKVLGADPQLSKAARKAVLDRGMARLRARRRLRVQVPEARLVALKKERPILMASLEKEPDLVIEAQADVSPGFARVVTEVGGALCSEQTALDQLAQAVNVDEHAVAPRPQSSVYALDARLPSVGDDEEDEPTANLQAPPPRAAPAREQQLPPTTRRAGVGLAVTSSEVNLGHVRSGGRARPLTYPDPEATQQLDLSDLQRELSEAEPDEADDDLDLFADESLP